MVGMGKYLLSAGIILCLICCIPVLAGTPCWETGVRGEYITGLAIADDGSHVIIGTTRGNARVYDRNGTLLWETRVPGSLMVGCRGNGTVFLLASQEDLYSNKGGVRLFSQDGTQLWLKNTGYTEAIDLPAQSDRILIGNRVADLLVLNEEGGEVAAFNELPRTYVVADLSMSDDGQVFSYTVHEMFPQIRFIRVDTGEKTNLTRLFESDLTGFGGDPLIQRVDVSSDGNYTASVQGEGGWDILCLHANDGTLLWTEEMDAIRDIAISGDGSSVCSGTGSGKITGYSREGYLSWEFISGSAITSLSRVSQNGLLAAGNDQGDLYLMNETGQLLWSTRIDEFPRGDVTLVELSRDGTSLVAVINRHTVHYFAVDTTFSVTSPLPTVCQDNTTVTNESGMGVSCTPVPTPVQEAIGPFRISLWELTKSFREFFKGEGK